MNLRSFCFSIGLLLAASTAHGQCFDTKIVSPLPAGSRFGASVSITGDDMLVGAPGADAVVFYRRVAGAWVQGATFTGPLGSSFGYDVSVNGNFAIVGAPFHDEASTATTDSGVVQLFIQGPPGTWTASPLFLPPNAQDNGHYGWAVDTDGAQVLVGAPGQNADKGNARVYDVIAGQLSQAQNLLALAVAGTNSRWGYDVAIDGLSLVIGAPRADVQGFTDNGMGAFYRRQLGSYVFQDYWTFQGPGVRTGLAVAVDDGRGVLQAAGSDSLLWSQWNGFTWALEDNTITAFAREAVALSGNRTLQGAPELSGAGIFSPNIGGVRLYTNDGGPDEWGFAPTASSLSEVTEELGESVAIDGDTGVVGEPLSDDNGVNAGAVHIYDTSVSAWDSGFEALTFIESTVNGIPFMSVDGSLCEDTPFTVSLGGGAPNALLTLVVGFSYLGAPFKGGLLGPQPDIFISGFVTSATGSFSLDTTFPAGVPNSFQFFMQAFLVDAGAPKGLSATNTLQATTPTLAP